MKKIFLSLAAAMLLTLSASADEGMWLLPLLEKMNAGEMMRLGCRLTPEQIYSINHSSIKDAVVHFGGGCTGEIISDQGLLVTNHHCGYSSIQGLSTPEHNYLEDGFWARSMAEELPVPGLSVTFLESMTDVTEQIQKINAMKPKRQEAAMKDLIARAEKAYPNCSAYVRSFYNDNVFYLIVEKIYRDVRFVGAPPAALGKFGGETDNWMWPRHTCDYSMFRVYSGPDGEPARYSEANIPLKPRRSLEISLKGIEDGDFAMIMGYPGRTQRFQTADQLRLMIDQNDISIAARTIRQDIMWEGMLADDTVHLQYANKYAGSANGWKKYIGMKQSFADLDIIAREEQKEADLMAWINQDPARAAKWGGAIAKISEGVAATRDARLNYYLISETLLRTELPTVHASNGLKDYNADLDKKMTKAMVKYYLENVAPAEKLDYDLSDANIDAMFADWQNPDNAIAKAFRSAAVSKAQAYAAAANAGAEAIADASRDYAAALLAWQAGKPSYPDANSTMRLTYGTVKSYEPKDGVLYKHYTTLKGVMEKENPDDYEFRVPAALKRIWNEKDFGQYANAAGEMPACFLINCDITGGNSGSPVLDADGRLIGLAFDGNWESMSSDVMFEPELQRCICVDIRYVLMTMDKMGGAGYLLKEMKLVK
ncbi:MAG: S46 family peptidase [Bacteroidales bacterium]|nr:S46 family peptidase [Bacteroidales bacterium]